jgi:hypothetical protein
MLIPTGHLQEPDNICRFKAVTYISHEPTQTRTSLFFPFHFNDQQFIVQSLCAKVRLSQQWEERRGGAHPERRESAEGGEVQGVSREMCD